MPRPKGSKNKVHTPRAARTAKNKIDYAALIAEKTAAKEQAEATVAALTANIDELKAQLKTAKAAVKAATKELTKAETKKGCCRDQSCRERKEGRSRGCAEKTAGQWHVCRRDRLQAAVIFGA